MTASLTSIRQALQTALEQIDGLRAHDIWPQSIVPPAAMVKPVTIVYTEAFDNMTTFNFEIVLAVRYASVRAAQAELDGYLDADGPRSIAAAVELDQTLGGLTDIVNVNTAHDYGDLMIGNTPYLGAIFDVTVQAR